MWRLVIVSLFFCVVSTSAQRPANASCECEKSEKVNSESGFYFVGYMKANWYGALEHCRTLGLNLVSLQTKEKSDRLKQYIKENGWDKAGLGNGIWISGSDLSEESSFTWAGTGEPFTYTDWRVGEPNHGPGDPERCVHYNKSADPKDEIGWNDMNCIWKNYFVCET